MGFACVFGVLSAFDQEGSSVAMLPVYESDREQNVMLTSGVLSFEFDDLNKML